MGNRSPVRSPARNHNKIAIIDSDLTKEDISEMEQAI